MKKLTYVPDTIMAIKPVSQTDVILAIAVLFYVDGEVSLAKGAEIAGITCFEFQELLADKNIPLRYDLDDLNRELKIVQMFLADHQA